MEVESYHDEVDAGTRVGLGRRGAAVPPERRRECLRGRADTKTGDSTEGSWWSPVWCVRVGWRGGGVPDASRLGAALGRKPEAAPALSLKPLVRILGRGKRWLAGRMGQDSGGDFWLPSPETVITLF
jgi:hypothetical protein